MTKIVTNEENRWKSETFKENPNSQIWKINFKGLQEDSIHIKI